MLCRPYENVVVASKNPIAIGDFHGFLHRNGEGTEQLRIIDIKQ